MSGPILIVLWAIYFVSTTKSQISGCEDATVWQPLVRDASKCPKPGVPNFTYYCPYTNQCLPPPVGLSKNCPDCSSSTMSWNVPCKVRGTGPGMGWKCCDKANQCGGGPPTPPPSLLPGSCDFNPLTNDGVPLPATCGNGGKFCQSLDECILPGQTKCPICQIPRPYGCKGVGTRNGYACCPRKADCPHLILPTPSPTLTPPPPPKSCDDPTWGRPIDNGNCLWCAALAKCQKPSTRLTCPMCPSGKPDICSFYVNGQSVPKCCDKYSHMRPDFCNPWQPDHPDHPAHQPSRRPHHPAHQPVYHPAYQPTPACGTNENTGDRGWMKCPRDIYCCRDYHCQSDGKCKPNGKPPGPPHQCGTNKNTGDRDPHWDCNRDVRCCNGYYCQRGNGKCKPNGKPPRGGGRNYAVSDTDNIDEAEPGSKNAYDEEIEVKAIATFESGVDGTVQVDENGNIFINLDLSNFDSNCGEYEYGIYNKFDGNGGFFNPFGSSVSCDDYNGNGDKYFECSIGDLSARFGNGIVDNNYEIVVEGNISENNNDKPGGFCVSRLTPEALYQRSIVFKCVDGDDMSFYAPFEITKSGGT